MRARRTSARRYTIIVVLVTSMALTLVSRLYYLQLLDPNKPVQTAGLLHQGIIFRQIGRRVGESSGPRLDPVDSVG